MTQLTLDGTAAAHSTVVVRLDDDTLEERRRKREPHVVGCVGCVPAGVHDVVYEWRGLCYCPSHRPHKPRS